MTTERIGTEISQDLDAIVVLDHLPHAGQDSVGGDGGLLGPEPSSCSKALVWCTHTVGYHLEDEEEKEDM